MSSKKEIKKVPILCISLPNHTERREYARKQFNEYFKNDQREYHIIDGVWGKDPETGVVHPDFNSDMCADTSRPLLHSEFGATMAHVNAAKFMVKNNMEAAFIIEDDADFSLKNQWPKTLEDIVSELPEGWTTCQLYFADLISDYNIVGIQKKENIYSWGCVAYLLSAKGARLISEIDIKSKRNWMVADVVTYTFEGAQPYLHFPRYVLTGALPTTVHDRVKVEDAMQNRVIINSFDHHLIDIMNMKE